MGELEEGEDLVGAGGNRLLTCGAWREKVETGGVVKWAHWEIIDLGGSAKMILGRPWLRDIGAVHNYLTDVIHIKGDDGEKELQPVQVDHRRIEEVVMGQASEAENEVQLKSPSAQQDEDSTPSRTAATFPLFGHAHCKTSSHWAALAVEMDDNEGDAGEDEETARESRDETLVLKKFLDEVLCIGEVYEARWRTMRLERRKKMRAKRAKIAEWLGALLDKTLAEAEEERRNLAVSEELNRVETAWEVSAKDLKWRTPAGTTNFSISKILELERITNLFGENRVKKILKVVEIGEAVTEEERHKEEELLKEYADVFALDVREVLPVDWSSHKLKGDLDAKLLKNTHQSTLIEAQRDWYNDMLDTMEEGGIIARVEVDFVQCISHTKLVPKDAGKVGMTKMEGIRKCNEVLKAAGRPAAFEEIEDSPLVEMRDPTITTVNESAPLKPKTKWRIVHAYRTINEGMKIPTFPMGDLKAKQRRVVGHAMGSVVDLASGYYVISMDNHAIPFTTFHVPGRGYYIYLRMPMGLTGVPYTFGEAVVTALGEMLGWELENWMDDIVFVSDLFEDHFSILTQFLSKCQGHQTLHCTEQNKVVPEGVCLCRGAPVTRRGKFTGLMNWFRHLIKDYGKIAQPLTDLMRNAKKEAEADERVREAKHGKKARKGNFKRFLRETHLGLKWTQECEDAFFKLKVLITSKPVL